MILFAGLGIALWPSWWAAPFWLAYGVLYGSAMDSRWHECSHGTAFKTRRHNDWLYQIASFCMVRNPVSWRWSHARHHTDTIIVGRDPEIVAMRPPALFRIALNFLGLFDAWNGWRRMLFNASGRIHPEEAAYIPNGEQPKVIRVARIWVAIYAATIGLALALGSILPLMVIGLPRLYGAWHHVLTGIMQHAGLAENVTDHRLNSRTVLINPVSRFIYWNMNYHVEHHMFPMVPYHRLPELHAAIKHDLPPANTSIWDAYAEILPVLWRQLAYEDVFLKRDLPASARPYREDFHSAALGTAAE
ncbi:fatty acid desaturase [Thalassococcus sp. BH17M4-6]|uniref:fatty acid desaturase n=1 Tax=Thalassococcus sp. BH17M4-6 TaxID=3413148 RepID=UPI003BD5BAA7